MEAPKKIYMSGTGRYSTIKLFKKDDIEYTRSDIHQRLVDAAREFLRVICSNTIQNNESLKAINALKAVLEGEKGAQETSCQATHE